MKRLIIVFLAIFVSACTTPVIDMTAEPTVQKFDLSDSESDGVIKARDDCPDTFSGAQVDNSGCSTETVKILRNELRVNFSNNSYEVRAEFFPAIEELAELIKKDPSSVVTIEGHTSKTGSAEHNQILSLQRAEAVKNILISRFAIDAARITAVGYGFDRLLFKGDDDYSNARNRRIVAETQTEVRRKNLKWTIYSVDDPAE